MLSKDSETYRNLNQKFEALLKDSEYEQAIPIIQDIVILLENNSDSQIFDDAIIKLAQTLNAAGMIALQNNNIEKSFKYLKRAENINTQNLMVKATTLNNLGCYYRKIKKFTIALSYLKKTLELELKQFNPINLSDTYINLCAVLNNLGQHEEAASNAMMAVILLQNQIIQKLMKKYKDEVINQSIVNSEKFSKVSLGLYNLGVQLEYLDKITQATRFYDKAIQITETYNNKNTKLLKKFQKLKKKIEVDLKKSKRIEDENQNKELQLKQRIRTEAENQQFYKNLVEKLKKDKESQSRFLRTNYSNFLKRSDSNNSKKYLRGASNPIKNQPTLFLQNQKSKMLKINTTRYKIKSFVQ